MSRCRQNQAVGRLKEQRSARLLSAVELQLVQTKKKKNPALTPPTKHADVRECEHAHGQVYSKVDEDETQQLASHVRKKVSSAAHLLTRSASVRLLQSSPVPINVLETGYNATPRGGAIATSQPYNKQSD